MDQNACNFSRTCWHFCHTCCKWLAMFQTTNTAFPKRRCYVTKGRQFWTEENRSIPRKSDVSQSQPTRWNWPLVPRRKCCVTLTLPSSNKSILHNLDRRKFAAGTPRPTLQQNSSFDSQIFWSIMYLLCETKSNKLNSNLQHFCLQATIGEHL